MAIKRLHYFNHQFLVEADFTDEQRYHLDMRRRLNRLLHTPGIAQGLEVEKSANKAVTVNPGTAIDRDGREMVLEADQVVDLSDAAQFPAGAPVFITIRYQETETDPSTATGAPGNRRITEQPIIQAVTVAPPNDGTVVRLGRFTLDGAANVPGNIGDFFDGGVRQRVTPQGGVGISSVDGVSNAGGNIDLIAGGAIQITPNDAANQITIGETHSARTDNPHQTTAAQVGALLSVDGVSNAGGNIDLIQGGAIVITPNDATNQITVSETHSARTDNPHQTTAAQIGALLAAEYDLRQRAIANMLFTNGDATGATRTVNVGFQPRLVFVTGTADYTMAGRNYSGGVSGFAELIGAISQSGSGFGITRMSNTDWIPRWSLSNSVFFARTFNQEVAPIQAENLTVNITAVSATGLTATFTRGVVNAANAPLDSFNIRLNLLCFG
jgi:hypothetical protein